MNCCFMLKRCLLKFVSWCWKSSRMFCKVVSVFFFTVILTGTFSFLPSLFFSLTTVSVVHCVKKTVTGWLVCLGWPPDVNVYLLSTWLVVCCWCHVLSCLLSDPALLVISLLFQSFHLCPTFVSPFIPQVSSVLC